MRSTLSLLVFLNTFDLSSKEEMLLISLIKILMLLFLKCIPLGNLRKQLDYSNVYLSFFIYI